MLGLHFTLRSRQQGVSLVELLVGVAVGMVVLAGAITVFAKISFSSLENTRAMKLNQQLRGTMDLIHRDLQRAGYVRAWEPGVTTWADSDAITDAMGSFGLITMGGTCSDSDGDGVDDTCDCIVYNYDRSDDGALDDDERFAFRLNTDDGSVESGTTATGCGDADAGSWEAITGDEIVVSTLSFQRANGAALFYDPANPDPAFDPADPGYDPGFAVVYQIEEGGVVEADCGPGDICLDRRKFNVVLEGELASDAAVTTVLRGEVKVKNDRYFLVP